MARIKIEQPEHFIFTTTIEVRVTDLNYGNHLGNDALLGIVHEARVRFYSSLGFPDERNVFGTGLIMADTAIQYRSEGFLADVLTISVGVHDINRMGYDLVYRIVNQHGAEVAIAKTGMVCFDYSIRKVCPLPEAFVAAVNLKR
ncbi:MAG: thioesterase family protein [Bacteroidota bacterium]